MTIKGSKRHRVTDWESLLPAAEDTGSTKGTRREVITDELTGVTIRELSDESVDEAVNFNDQYREFYYAEHGTEVLTDGDDNPEQAQPKQRIDINSRTVRVKLNNGKTSRVEVISPGDVVEAAVVKPSSNPAGEIADAGHGFIVNDPRSRPWKTARRTHCAHCGGELPKPDVSGYKCEFDPGHPGCQCSGCSLRRLVANGHERNKGQPRMCCSAECTRLRDNERARWKRAVACAEKRGEDPPPEPEDRGLKLSQHYGPKSSIEGHGHRYTAANDGCLSPGIPRA